MNPEFAKMVSTLADDKKAIARGDDNFALDRFKQLLREGGFRWTDDYFEKHLIDLVAEAAQRQQIKQASRDPSTSSG
jgi:hypothetical protein